ncbi:MAG: NYN domain-containing protein [Promethearchaeota archaeon]
MKKVAVIVDGGFVRKTFQKYFKNSNVPTANQIVELSNRILKDDEELFRIYYYDCPPFEKDLKKPISKDIFKDEMFINSGKVFISTLKKREHLAYRRGELKFGGWAIKNSKIDEIIETGRTINDDDFRPLLKQKRVDIKIGLDIAWLAIKRIVERIILIAGDSDFVPAMKLARIEGVQITVAPLKNPINLDMREHSDEIRDYDISILRDI